MARFNGFQETTFDADWREYDRRIAGTISVIAAHLHALVPYGERVGVRTPQGILVEREVGDVRYVVRAGHNPLLDPIMVEMVGVGEYRAARNWDCSYEWGPARTDKFPANWKNQSHIVNQVGHAVMSRLERLHAKIRSEHHAAEDDQGRAG